MRHPPHAGSTRTDAQSPEHTWSETPQNARPSRAPARLPEASHLAKTSVPNKCRIREHYGAQTGRGRLEPVHAVELCDPVVQGTERVLVGRETLGGARCVLENGRARVGGRGERAHSVDRHGRMVRLARCWAISVGLCCSTHHEQSQRGGRTWRSRPPAHSRLGRAPGFAGSRATSLALSVVRPAEVWPCSPLTWLLFRDRTAAAILVVLTHDAVVDEKKEQ